MVAAVQWPLSEETHVMGGCTHDSDGKFHHYECFDDYAPHITLIEMCKKHFREKDNWRLKSVVWGQGTKCTFAFRWPGEKCGMVELILPNGL